MTLRMYADRTGLPLDGVSVALQHKKIHAADCRTCETGEGQIDRIDRARRALSGAQPSRAARFTADTTARSDAVVIEVAIPTPQTVRPPTDAST